MEVIIRDEKMPKNCYECSYLEICSLKPNFEPTISKCPLKSLTQHDAELKTKWCDDLMELANKKMVWTDDLTGTYTGIGYKIFQNVLKQKLEEMKGEK